MNKQLAVLLIFFGVLCGGVLIASSLGGGDNYAYLPLAIGGDGSGEPPSDPGDGETEMVIFTWDGNVNKSDHGFPRAQPPDENGNWVTPVNYAEGTLHIKTEIVSQPVPQQDMRLQFCFWQEKDGNRFGLETCMKTINVPGNPGVTKCWSETIEQMWKKNNQPLEWDRERYRVAVPIKNGAGLAVSDYNGWEWNGEDPDEWYPLNLKATVIVVAKDAEFSGWDNYGGC